MLYIRAIKVRQRRVVNVEGFDSHSERVLFAHSLVHRDVFL